MADELGPDIFVTAPGSVAIFEEKDRVILMPIKFEDLETKMVMISGIDYKQSVDAQFQTSLERDIYAYVFGDNMGEAALHGRVYQRCDSDTSKARRTGFDDVLDTYAQKRMSQQPETVKLKVGEDRTIEGYLTALAVKAVGLSDEPSGLVYDFTMVINTVPSLGNGSGSGKSGS